MLFVLRIGLMCSIKIVRVSAFFSLRRFCGLEIYELIL